MTETTKLQDVTEIANLMERLTPEEQYAVVVDAFRVNLKIDADARAVFERAFGAMSVEDFIMLCATVFRAGLAAYADGGRQTPEEVISAVGIYVNLFVAHANARRTVQ